MRPTRPIKPTRPKRPMVKKTNSRGTAMLAVLMFITFVLILAVGILALADASVRQSGVLGISDNVFYSMESALQVYMQLVDERVRTIDILSDSYDTAFSTLDSSTAIATWQSNHLTYIKNQLLTIYNDVKPAASGSLGIAIDFYLGDVLLNLDDPTSHTPEELAMIGDTRDQIKEEFERIMEEDPALSGSFAGEIWTAVSFYPAKAITYSVTATMGGRTLVANVDSVFTVDPEEASSSRTGDAIPKFGDTLFIKPEGGRGNKDDLLKFGTYDGGAYYKNNNTNVYEALKKNDDGSYDMKEEGTGKVYQWETITQNEKKKAYDGLIIQLKYVISETDALTRDRVLGNIPTTDPRWDLGTNKNAKYIKVTGNYTLTGNYPNLEYLEVVNGNLTISGTVTCPKLRGVFVGGGTGTEAITISTNVEFSGNASIGGTKFLTKGRDIKFNTDNKRIRLLNGKFLASGGNVTITVSGGGSADAQSNSMFVATKNGNANKGKLATTGQNFRMDAYSAEQVPQYYAENDLTLYVQNSNASFQGIFATLTDNDIFNGTVNNGNLTGIFVGNCSKIATSVRILPFNPAQANKMLPGGLFDSEGEGFIYVPGEVEVAPQDGSLFITINGVNFGGEAKLVIRETTGDGDLS